MKSTFMQIGNEVCYVGTVTPDVVANMKMRYEGGFKVHDVNDHYVVNSMTMTSHLIGKIW